MLRLDQLPVPWVTAFEQAASQARLV